MRTATPRTPMFETHRIRYRDLIVEKDVPTDIFGDRFAASIYSDFKEFADGMPNMAIIDAIEDGVPMMLVDGLPFEQGLATPLLTTYDDYATATFADRGNSVLSSVSGDTVLPFDILNPRSVAFLKTYKYGLITNIVAEQKAIISEAILHAFKEGYGGYKAARLFRGQIGLTERQAGALRKFADRQYMSGVKSDVARKRIARYEQRLHKYRADRIARTELNRAANAGEIEGWRQAADTGMIDREKTKKHWLSYLDNRTSDYCESNDGQVAFLDEPFEEGFDCPPAHPHCRSTIWVEYVLKKPGSKPAQEPEQISQLPTANYRPAKYKSLDDWQESKLYKDWRTGNATEVMEKFYPAMPTHGNTTLHYIQEEQGFNGMPNLVSKAQMDALEAADKRIMYRGIKNGRGSIADDLYEQYMRGEHYAGRGIYGDGTYHANQRTMRELLEEVNGNEARARFVFNAKKARAQETAILYSDETAFMRQSLDEAVDKKLINYLDLADDFEKAKIAVANELEPIRYAIAGEDGYERAQFLRFLEEVILKEEGTYGTAMGYDGWYIKRDAYDYIITQNRTAVIVQDELIQDVFKP